MRAVVSALLPQSLVVGAKRFLVKCFQPKSKVNTTASFRGMFLKEPVETQSENKLAG